MDDEILRLVILDQQEENQSIIEQNTIIKRDLPYNSILRGLENPNILALLGVRRCGKSIASHLLLNNKQYGYINFDDERLLNITAKDLNQILQVFYQLYGNDLEYIILDEIQNVKGWELFANRLRRTKKIILTGSNAQLLSGELASHLTGRYIDFTLFPFSFKELLLFKKIKLKKSTTKQMSQLKKMLQDYLKTGGFPEAYLLGRNILSRIFNDVIYKDILSRNNIRNSKNLIELATYLVSHSADEFSYRKLKDVTSIKDEHTIKNYVHYLELSYILFIVERFSFKLKEQIKAPKKIYCIDNGIINAVSISFSQNVGKLMENCVAVELYRTISYKENQSLFYWKDHDQHEIDFLIKEEKKIKELIQVSYVSKQDEIKKREINNLLKASKELECKNMTLITWDFEGKIENIRCIPLWKWLLSQSP